VQCLREYLLRRRRLPEMQVRSEAVNIKHPKPQNLKTFKDMSKLFTKNFWEKLAYMWREFLAALCVVLCASVLGCCSCYAAGSATASDVALKGGMSIIDGTWLNQMLTGIAAIIGAVGGIVATLTYCNRRDAKKERAQRPVDSDDRYVTQLECKQHRCAIDRRIDALTPMLKQISDAVERSASRAEERAVQLHRRLDPIVEKVAANSAKIEMFEELASKATVGGKK